MSVSKRRELTGARGVMAAVREAQNRKNRKKAAVREKPQHDLLDGQIRTVPEDAKGRRRSSVVVKFDNPLQKTAMFDENTLLSRNYPTFDYKKHFGVDGTFWFTPEVAEDLLIYHNENNRILERPTYMKYASMMATGTFRYTGGNITFDENGELLQGQHRLVAGARVAKVAFLSSVKWGVAREAAPYVDMTKATQPHHTLQYAGADPSKSRDIASMINKVWYVYALWGRTDTYQATQDITREFYLKYSDKIAEALELAYSAKVVKKHLVLPPSVGLALSYLLLDEVGSSHKEELRQFLTQVATGNNVQPDTAMDALWRRFRNWKQTSRRASSAPDWSELMALVIKTWNAVADGYDIDQLRWGTKEDMPHISAVIEAPL